MQDRPSSITIWLYSTQTVSLRFNIPGISYTQELDPYKLTVNVPNASAIDNHDGTITINGHNANFFKSESATFTDVV